MLLGVINQGSQGSDNPDSYAAASNTYVSLDYETGVPATDSVNAGDSNHSMNYESTGSFDGSGCYGLEFLSVQAPGGWNGAWGGAALGSVDTTSNSLFCSSVIKISQEFADHIAGAGINHVAKFWDGYYYLANGDAPGGGGADYRWVSKLGNVGGGPADTLPANVVSADPNMPVAAMFWDSVAGAGADYANQGSWQDWSEFPYTNVAGGGSNVDGLFKLEDFADQWIWFCLVFDAANEMIRYYFKTQTGTYSDKVYKVLERPLTWPYSTDIYGDPAGGSGWDYSTPTRGWVDMDFGNYWAEIDSALVDGSSHFWQDRVRISDGWIDPPF